MVRVLPIEILAGMKDKALGRIDRTAAIDPDRIIGQAVVDAGFDAEAFEDVDEGQDTHGNIHHHPHGAGLVMLQHIDDRMGEIAVGHAGRGDQKFASEGIGAGLACLRNPGNQRKRQGNGGSRRSIRPRRHHSPVLGIDAQGSSRGSAPPFCSSSTEILSGERMKAMRPSRGGRFMVTPASCSFRQVSYIFSTP